MKRWFVRMCYWAIYARKRVACTHTYHRLYFGPNPGWYSCDRWKCHPGLHKSGMVDGGTFAWENAK